MFFDNLDKMELEKLEGAGVLTRYEIGSAIIEEGMPGSSFGVILTGKAEVRKKLEGGKHKALVVIGPFDLIGELGFLGVESRSASVIALEVTEVLSFERKAFQALAERFPHIGMVIYQNMARILAERLASNNISLMDTIVWALGRPRGVSAEASGTGGSRFRWAG